MAHLIVVRRASGETTCRRPTSRELSPSPGTYSAPPQLVVVSSLQEIDGLVTDAIHQPVFLCDTARPAPGKHIFQRFGLSRTFERIPHHCLNEIEDSDRDAALVFDPEPEVLKELRLKYGDPLRLPLHQASLSAMRPLFGV